MKKKEDMFIYIHICKDVSLFIYGMPSICDFDHLSHYFFNRYYLLILDEVKLYIGNLSFDTEEDTLRSLFEEFGTLIDLYMPLDRFSGRPRGFAFVTMSRDDAPNAIDATDGLELDGRILRVNEAQPKGYSPPRYEEGDWDEEGDWNEEE